MLTLTPMKTRRFDVVDALRGAAMVWMTLFHFCFDLNQFGYIQQNFYSDARWTWQRTLIVSLFLFCAGLGQALAFAQQQSWAHFWRRWMWLVACALLVSLGSWWMYPNSFIYFGVLHGMALMLIVARLTVSWGAWLWGLGALAIASKFIAAYAIQMWATGYFSYLLNAPVLNWIGWITKKPVTEDYVPLFPWLGVMWWGVAAGSWLLQHRPDLLRHAVTPAFKPLVVMGRWSLVYYMLHQPVMIGLLLLVRRFF